MTCNQLRRFLFSFDTTTRGERSAMGLHMNDCAGCRAWLDRVPLIPASDPLAREVEAMLAADLADPEYGGSDVHRNRACDDVRR